MANISISGLTPAGSGLFAGSESYLRDLSEAELGISGGGGKSGKSGKSKKSGKSGKSSKSGGDCCCH